MVEKKTKLISVRVPLSWKIRFQERGIEISEICRSALYQALQQSDLVLSAGSKLRSKQRATSLFNGLSGARVRTISDESWPEMCRIQHKLPHFRELIAGNPANSPQELIILGEFLNQGEFAEEVLQEAYKNDS